MQERTVLEGARLALVGVADDVLHLAGGLADGLPLGREGEARAATAQKAAGAQGRDDLLGVVGLHDAAQLRVAAVGAVDVERAQAGVRMSRKRTSSTPSTLAGGGGARKGSAAVPRNTPFAKGGRGLVAEAGAGDALAGLAPAHADAGEAARRAAARALAEQVVLAEVGVVVEGGGLMDVGGGDAEGAGELVEGLLGHHAVLLHGVMEHRQERRVGPGTVFHNLILATVVPFLQSTVCGVAVSPMRILACYHR